MEILEWVSKKFDYQRKSTTVCLFFLYAVATVVGIFYLADKPRILSLLPIICLYAFCGIIHIWIYCAANLLKRVKAQRGLFSTGKSSCDEYIMVYEKHLRRLHQFQGDTKDGLIFCVMKFVFPLFWFGWFIALTIFNSQLGTLSFQGFGASWCETVYSIVFFLLFLISFFLNFSTFYYSIVACYFYREVSNLIQEDGKSMLPYNRFLPSATSDFRTLVSDARMVSITFLAVTFLLTLIQGLLILWKIGITNADLPELSQNIVEGLSIAVVVLGFASFLTVDLVPKVFLDRTLRNWKKESLVSFEKQLNETTPNEITPQNQSIVSVIQRLAADKVPLKIHGFEFFVLLSTFVSNLVTLISVIRAR